ncbi:MAG: hypothetical protein UY04_C0011G0005 [Parcubacteria group bacterium GW2011_GWA2_47_7]|nr:MAG: hypothetical protein UY04_C0011G0005 [Parcubacteria group bacterium GW2011_GWA2_47_7]
MRSTDAFIYHFNDTELSFSAGNSTVFYPETSSRYLRVVIHKENEKMELLGISGVRVYRDTLPVNKEDEMSVSATIGENQKEQSTEIIIDLGGGGLSTKAITLNLKDGSNFNRRATIHGSANGENWSLIGQGYLFQVFTPLFSGVELTLRYPEVSYRYLRVVVFNDDNQPVQFGHTVSLGSTLRSVVFAATVRGEYALYYGNTNAKTPHYDLARFFQYIESITVPRAALGTQTPNDAYAPAMPPKKPFTDEYPQLVNVTLIVLITIVTLLMFAYIKKLKLERPHE